MTANTSNPDLNVATFELQQGTTLIEASAGTGKTFTIQYIVLDLLFKGLSLQEILVVTFTEAATKELTDRLQSFLSEVDRILRGEIEASSELRQVLDRAVERMGAESVARCIAEALLEIDQAAIYTIHGFCQRALQENAFAADANFDVELCADPQSIVDELVMDFLRRLHLEMAVPPPKGVSQITLRQRGLKLTGMLRSKCPAEKDLSDLGSGLAQLASEIQAYSDSFDPIVEEFMGYEGELNGRSYSAAYFNSFPETLRAALSHPLAADLTKLRASEIGSKFKKDYLGTELKSGFFAACEAMEAAKADLLPAILNCFDTWFIDSFQKVKQERGLITYADMIFDLDRALAGSEQLKEQLKQRYRAALVDEFQDTDNRQYSIFRQLFGEDSSAGRYFAMIGDPKQSIYGFRGADIKAYLMAREAAVECFTLPKNYRSEQSLVDATNAFFEGSDLGAAQGDGEAQSIPFTPVTAADKIDERLVFADGGEFSFFYERLLPDPKDGKVKTAHESSARETAEDISRLLRLSEEGLVYFEKATEEDPRRRAIKASDIAVLVNTHFEAQGIQAELQKLGVVAVRAKTGSIWESEEAVDFLHFMRACLDPRESSINLLLVRPLYAKTNAQMRSLNDGALREIFETFTIMGTRWREGAGISSVWLAFLDRLKLKERLLNELGGERKLTNYLHVSEFAQELERTESLSPERLCDRLFEAVSSGSQSLLKDEYLMRLESDAEAIKITTIHGSKGLEFPIVFLPSLWQRCVSKNSKTDEAVTSDVNDPDCFAGFSVDKDKAITEASAEIMRLGYVAATRAVHFCVYYNVRDLDRPGGQSSHADGWFDQWLYQQRGERYRSVGNMVFLEGLESAKPVSLDAVPEIVTAQERRFPNPVSGSYQITSYSSISRHEKEKVSDRDPSVVAGSEDVASPISGAGSVVDDSVEPDLLLPNFPGGVRTGTCVHEILERCDFTQSQHWEAIVRSGVERHFPDGDEALLDRRVAQVVELSKQLTHRPFSSGQGAPVDLAALAAKCCIPEMEFYFPVEGVDVLKLEQILESWSVRVGLGYRATRYVPRRIDGYLTGSVDLFFTQNGRYYLLDWKTNSPLPGHPHLKSSYDRDGMHAHMCHGHYYLQALIYSVATSAYLRQRLGGRFDWKTQIGGFIYCFVRGLGEGSGWLHESFSEDEVAAAADALGQKLLQKGGA